MMSFNENKLMNKCLQLLIKELRHLHHDLESIFRINDFIHNKLINACQKILHVNMHALNRAIV